MIPELEITSGDFLAGGGGVTEAMAKTSGMKVKWVLNHNKIAIRTNIFNHKGVKHFWSDIYKQDEHEMEPVDFVWASIECSQHSNAKGGGEKNIGSYMLGWELVRYLKYMYPLIIGIENVPEFKKWAPLDKKGKPDKKRIGEEFERWKNAICALGYDYHESIRNAANDGIPTRRIRYFAFFTRKELGMQVNWPEQTHSKNGTGGFKKWVACKDYIDLKNEGNSIFGRKFNPNLQKNKRHPICTNTQRRIAGGIKRFAPELYSALQEFSKQFIVHYYSNGNTSQSINDPLNTISTKDRHMLVTLEKMQFIQDYCRADIYDKVEDPLSPQLTWQTKHLITIEKQFLADYYSRDDTAHSLDGPANTIRCDNSKHLVSAKFISKHFSGDGHNAESLDGPLPSITTIDHNSIITANFISKQYNSNGTPEANNYSVDDPLGALTTQEKNQFITAYFNSSNNPESQNQDVESPLGSILTGTNKKALITAFQKGLVDFDIKMRFLDPEELAAISTFPKKYFTHPQLKLTKKEQTWLIGNAVPPEWAKKIISPVVDELRGILMARKMAI
ncbi:MAG: DNA cytosine methyltransferase [Paludibacter sp.]|nr:DNA cytosine methyltransferase [Paludibacter sp.]